MDDTLLFIPPCCVDKKLPKAVMQAPSRSLAFYTHGDVSMEKFYRAVSYLVSDPHVMALAMPVVTNETVAFLAQCFDRGWITALVLSTARPADSLLQRFLFPAYEKRVLYMCSDDVTTASSHLTLYNHRQALVLQGPMAAVRCDSPLVGYHLQYLASHNLSSSNLDWGNTVRNVLLPDVLRHRKNLYGRKRNNMRLGCEELNRFIGNDFPPYKEDY